MTQTFTRPPHLTAETFLQAIADLRSARANTQTALEATAEYTALRAAQAALEATPEWRAVRSTEKLEAEYVEQLKTELKAHPGVFSTSYGKCGYEVRRTLTYSPASVRELIPEAAGLLINEAVDKATLEKLVPTLVKAGKAEEGTLDQLKARASVKEVLAWIFKPDGAPSLDVDPAEVTGLGPADAAEVRKEFFAVVKGTHLDNSGARADFLTRFTAGATPSLAAFLSTATAADCRRMIAALNAAVAGEAQP